LIKTPELTADQQHPFYSIPAEKLGFKLSDVIEKLLATDGSTVYEELDCVGLRPSGLSNELVAVLRIKRSSGFSGGPCTHGSREYVTFWGDFNNNGTYETCLGTASVQVFDLPVPKDGLEYAVRLHGPASSDQRKCHAWDGKIPYNEMMKVMAWSTLQSVGVSMSIRAPSSTSW
jgi:hypothetical protein